MSTSVVCWTRRHDKSDGQPKIGSPRPTWRELNNAGMKNTREWWLTARTTTADDLIADKSRRRGMVGDCCVATASRRRTPAWDPGRAKARTPVSLAGLDCSATKLNAVCEQSFSNLVCNAT
jgi:hypothetical protein